MRKLLIALRPVALILTALFLTSCKVAVVVPEGGHVEWDGGSCGSEDVCIFDVKDFAFIRQHQAIPAPGWEFMGWQKGRNYFCGRSPNHCELTLLAVAEFEDSEELNKRNLYQAIADLLADDERTFFLSPIFREVGVPVQSFYFLDNPVDTPKPWIHSLQKDVIETNDGFYFVYEDVDRDKESHYIAKITHRPHAVLCADWCWITDFATHFVRHVSPNTLFDEGSKFEATYIQTSTGDTILHSYGLDRKAEPWESFTGHATSFNGDVRIAVDGSNQVYYNHDGEWRLLSERLQFSGTLPDFFGGTDLVATNDTVWIVNEDRAFQVRALSSTEFSVGEKIHQMIPDSENGGVWALMGNGLYFFPKDGNGWTVVVADLWEGTGLEDLGAAGPAPFRMAQDEGYIYTNFFKAIRKSTGRICRYINRDISGDTFEEFRVMNRLYVSGPVSVNDGYGEIYFIYDDTSEIATLRGPVSNIVVTVSSFVAGCPDWTPAY